MSSHPVVLGDHRVISSGAEEPSELYVAVLLRPKNIEN